MFRHLKLEIALAITALNDETYNVKSDDRSSVLISAYKPAPLTFSTIRESFPGWLLNRPVLLLSEGDPEGCPWYTWWQFNSVDTSWIDLYSSCHEGVQRVVHGNL